MDEDLIVKVSRMYYVSDISKKDIGDRLGISRFRVSRLLDQARQSGIVRIEIFEPISTYTEIEAQLEEKFGLQYAVVVQPPSQEEKDVMHAIGRVGAEHLVSLLGEGDVVGITWGATVNEVIKALPARVEVRIQVVQITGGSDQLAIDVNPIDLVRRVAEVYNARSHVLFAPVFMQSKATRDELLLNSSIQNTVSLFPKVNVALSGIGAFSKEIASNLLRSGSLNNEDLKRLREKNAVGDVFGHFFDVHGAICDTELENRLIGMSVSQLKKVRFSIGVAGGLHKSLAVLGALRGKLINILVTDLQTARDILEKDAQLKA